MAANNRRNPNEIMKTLVEITDEFDGFVMGLGSKNDFYIFRPAENKIEIATENLLKDLQAKKQLSEEDYLRRGFFSTILDSAVGAYYTHDIINGKGVFSREEASTPKLSDHLMILTDTGAISTDTANFGDVMLKEGHNKAYHGDTAKQIDLQTKKASAAAMIREHRDPIIPSTFTGVLEQQGATAAQIAQISSEDMTNYSTFYNNLSEDEKALWLKEEKVPTVYPDIANKAGKISNPSLTDKKLTAFVIKNRNMVFGNRRIDFLSLFFNAMPPLEMARCTPYIEMMFYHQNFTNHSEYYLNPIGYMRFHGDIGEDGRLKPSSFAGSTYPIEEEADRETYLSSDIGYMNLFTSPQTMVNANINSEPSTLGLGDIKSNPFNSALEPFAPQATLNSIQIRTTSGGHGFTSEKKGDINLTIHDRSRLKHFAPIVSINQLASSRVKITFGWSHPDGHVNSGNPIGRFLDSLKSSQHYSILSSDMRLEGNSVSVAMKISSLGNQHVSDYPAAAGLSVPLRNIGPSIETIVQSLVEKAKAEANNGKTESVGRIHPQLDLIVNASNSTETVVSSHDYEELQKLVRQNKDGSLDEQIVQRVGVMLGIPEDKIVNKSNVIVKKNIKDAKEEEGGNAKFNKSIMNSIKKNTGEILRQKFETLFEINSENYLTQPDYFADQCLVNGAMQATNDLHHQKDTVSLGKCIANFVAAPMLASGEYSEVQMFFYPLNNLSGGARKYTTASLPIRKDELRSIIDIKDDKKEMTPEEESILAGSISAVGMFRKIAALTQSTDLDAYGLVSVSPSTQAKNTEAAIKECEKNPGLKGAVLQEHFNNVKGQEEAFNSADAEGKKAILKTAISKKIRDEAKENKTKLLAKIYSSDGAGPQDVNEFKFPNLNISFEALAPIKPPGEPGAFSFLMPSEKGTEASAYYDANGRILRIHVTDDAALGNEKAELATQILYGGLKDVAKQKAPARILKEGVNNLSDAELKEFIKRHYTTIIYGSQTSTVKSINISATTSDRIAQAKLMTLQKKQRSKSVSKNVNTVAETVKMIPASIDLQILGCPLIERGNIVFIDMGTNTDLDNCYIVNSVTHSLSKGDFTTSLGLVVGHQGTITNARGNMLKKLDAILNPKDLKTD